MGKARRRELLVVLDREEGQALYTQIYVQIRNAISTGQLGEGDKLPSIRNLSVELDVSHTTVEQAYLQLSVEGYVENVPRSGYRVKKLDIEYLNLDHVDSRAAIASIEREYGAGPFHHENAEGAKVLYDFSFANLQPGSFPVKVWRRLVNEVLYANTAPDLERYSNVMEPNALRVELAAYLQRVRGVRCTPSQVFVQTGTAEALSTIFQLFNRNADVVGIEEPGYYAVHEVAARNGFHTVGLPVSEAPTRFMDAVRNANPDVVFATPSHQFPTGFIMPLDTRIELLQWANETGAYVIEDDSCNEYRYDTRPIPSLHSLDAYDRVIYLGNLSKVLSPGLRCAYFVLPPVLFARYLGLFHHAHPPMSWLDQEVVARFISGGHLEQHIRKMTTSNRKRHDLLLSELLRVLGDRVELSGTESGMHLFARVNNGMSQRELLESAYAQGAKVYGTKHMWHSAPAPENCLIIGFSAIRDEDIAPGVAALGRAWCG